MSTNDHFLSSHDELKIAEEFGFEQLAVIAVKRAFGIRRKLEAIHFAGTDVVVDGPAKDEHGVTHHRRRVEKTA